MSALTDLYIDDAYPGLLHSNAVELPVDGQEDIYDGKGNKSSLKLGRSCNGATVCGTLTVDNLTINGASWLDLIFPIGSVFFTSNPLGPPAALLGGTWQAIGQGRFIAGVGTSIDKNGVSGTVEPSGLGSGGEYKHVLTTAELPAHTHGLNKVLQWPVQSGSVIATEQNQEGDVEDQNSYAATTEITGSGTAHNNMPPTYGLYLFERTA